MGNFPGWEIPACSNHFCRLLRDYSSNFNSGIVNFFFCNQEIKLNPFGVFRHTFGVVRHNQHPVNRHCDRQGQFQDNPKQNKLNPLKS